MIEREQLLYGTDGRLVKRIPVSASGSLSYRGEDVIEEHVRVVNSENRNFVAIRIPLAAGFEALNPALATAPKEAFPAGRITAAASYVQYLDDSVSYYYDTLAPGTYDFYFRVKASISGSFTQPPARAELMYDTAVKGRSNGSLVVIHAEDEK